MTITKNRNVSEESDESDVKKRPVQKSKKHT